MQSPIYPPGLPLLMAIPQIAGVTVRTAVVVAVGGDRGVVHRHDRGRRGRHHCGGAARAVPVVPLPVDSADE